MMTEEFRYSFDMTKPENWRAMLKELLVILKPMNLPEHERVVKWAIIETHDCEPIKRNG
jgi:hypothetical protein